MNGERKAILFVTGLIVFCLTVVAVLVFASLWPQRQVVAWVLLVVFGSIALALVFVPAAGKVNEMTIRHKRYHHHDETPLDEDGNPTHLPAGAQQYQRERAQPKEMRVYE